MRTFIALSLLLPALARAQEPLAVVRSFEAAWMAKKTAAAVDHFTDDCEVRVVFDTPPPGTDKLVPDAVFVGREKAAEFIALTISGLSQTASDYKVDGLRVTWTVRAKSDAMRRLGVAEAETYREAWLRADKIQKLTITWSPATAAIAIRGIPAANKAVVRRYHSELNRKNWAVLDETVAPGLIQHTILPLGPGLKGLKDFYAVFRKAFPDFHFTLDDVLADGDKVIVRMTIRGTHRGEFMGIQPSGKAVVYSKMDVFRVFNGKIVEHWDQVDRLGLLQQLGVVPRLPRWEKRPGYDSGFR